MKFAILCVFLMLFVLLAATGAHAAQPADPAAQKAARDQLCTDEAKAAVKAMRENPPPGTVRIPLFQLRDAERWIEADRKKTKVGNCS